MLNVHESSSIKFNPKTICWHGSNCEYRIPMRYLQIPHHIPNAYQRIENSKLLREYFCYLSQMHIYICLLPPCPILWFTYDSNNKKGKFITLGQWKREVIKKSDKPGSFFGYKLLVPHKAIQSGICMYVLYTSKVAEPNRVPTMHSRLCFGSEMCHIFQKRLAAILK